MHSPHAKTYLGMKPIMLPSFTTRPIHQSSLNFWKKSEIKKVKYKENTEQIKLVALYA
jgi:hypothetical protein